jgi:hypothetical protein
VIIGNIFRELPCSDFDGSAEIILFQKWNHGAASITGASVLDDGFDSIADFDAIFAIVWRKKQQDAGAFFFGADTKMFEESDGVIFDGTSVERPNGDDGELSAGFLVEFGAERFKALASGGRNNAGEIRDVSGGRDFLNVIGGNGVRAKEQQKENAKG